MLMQPSFFFFNTGFGSALNIETLVAAAERRETPIEVFDEPLSVFHSNSYRKFVLTFS